MCRSIIKRYFHLAYLLATDRDSFPDAGAWGGVAKLDLSLIQGINQFIFTEMLQNLPHGDKLKLDDVLEGVVLAYTIDPRQADETITKANFYCGPRPRELMRSGNCYVVEDLVQFFAASDENFLLSGLNLMRFASETSLIHSN